MVATAMTGDELPVIGRLVTEHVLPLLHGHHIRYAQIVQGSPSQTHDIAVLDDIRAPQQLYLDGTWRLSDELPATGTVPRVAAAAREALRTRAEPWTTSGRRDCGQPFRHVIGFEKGEAARARRDDSYDAATRTGWYPLLE
jgi:hypothetical protein